MERLEEIRDIINKALKEKGIGRMEFSRLMKVPPSTVTKWLNEENNFQLKTLFRIEKVLEIQIIYIIKETT